MDSIIEVYIKDLIGGQADGFGLFIVNGKTLKCFIPEWLHDGWYDREKGEKNLSLIGSKIEASISLLNLREIEKNENNEKGIEYAPSIGVNYHIVKGKVLKKMGEVKYLIDCGVPIGFGPTRRKLENGDYIIATGRLDIKLIK